MTHEQQAPLPDHAPSTPAVAPDAEPLAVLGAAGDDMDDELEAQVALRNLEQRRAAKRRKKRLKLAAACAIAGGVLAVVLGRSLLAPPQDEEYTPELATVERTDFSDSVSSSGALKAGSTVVVMPEVDGIVESISVQEGQEVKQGDVLLTLKNDSLEKAVASAAQDVQSAEKDVASAQTEVAQAQAARDEEWARYYEQWAEADALHDEWEYWEENYEELYAEWEELMDEAEAAACGKPVDPGSEPVQPGSEPRMSGYGSKEEYEAAHEEWEKQKETHDKWLEAKNEYLENLAAYQRYQDLLEQAGEEPEPAGEEPVYPEAPDDIALVSSINAANDGVTSACEASTKAKEAYDEAVEEAAMRTVTSPADGNVVALDVTVGQAVGGASGGTSDHISDGPLMQIVDVTKMSVDIEVNEIDILSIRAGQKATVTFSAVPDIELPATVQEVSTVATGGEDGGGIVTFHVGLVIPHPDERLRPGMTANVRIDTVDVPDALIIPAAALIEDGGSASVEVVLDEETLETELRPVKVGARNSMQVVIEEGLEEGDVVVVSMGGFGDEAAENEEV